MNVRRFSLPLLALALSLSTSIQFAVANQCGDISPLFSQLGQQYHELENTPESELLEQTITPNTLIEALQSNRFDRGHGQRTRCIGSSTLREKTRHMVLESLEPARVNNFNELVLKAFEYDARNKTSHRETLFIPLSSQRISLIGNDGFIVSMRHRQPVNIKINHSINSIKARHYTHLREISMTGVSTEEGIELTQLIYVNGYLAEWVTWKLGE